MKNEQYVARLWVENYDYQSNTVIIAELVLRGWRNEMKPTIPAIKYKYANSPSIKPLLLKK
jgi:hypothetical protein